MPLLQRYDRRTRYSAGLALSLSVAFIVVFSRQAGAMPTVIVGGAMIGGLVAWLATTARYPAHPDRVLPIYGITTALLMLHILEEYWTGFGPRIAALNGTNWSQAQFVVTIGFVVPLFWIAAGLLLYRRHPLGNWILWFIVLGMIVGEPAHLLVFPIREGGRYHYFPGMWTALLPMVGGAWAVATLLEDYRRDRRSRAMDALTPESQPGRGEAP